jgi:hypothetical protein
MNRRLMTALVAAGTAALAPLAAGQERSREPDRPTLIPDVRTVDLRPKWEKGQQIHYTLELKNASLNDAKAPSPASRGGRPPAPRAGQPARPAGPSLKENESRSTVQMGLVFKVADVSPEKVATVGVTIDRLKLATATPDGDVEFDSSKPGTGGDEDLLAQAFKSIVGTTMTMTVDRPGTIPPVTGGEGLAMLGGIGGAGAAPGGTPGQLFGPIFSGRPAKGEARVGESWDYDDALATGLLGDFKMKVRHTLTGLRGSDAVVSIRGQIDPKSEAPGSSAFQLKDSSYNGQYLWDTSKGQLRSMETSMSVRLDGKTGDNQDLATRNEATVKITRDRATH